MLDIFCKGTKELCFKVEGPQLQYLMTQFELKEETYSELHKERLIFSKLENPNLTTIMIVYSLETLFLT